jgi:TatD DNase family protein
VTTNDVRDSLHVAELRQVFVDKKGREVPAPTPVAPLADTHGHLTHFRRTSAAHALVRAALAGVRLLVVPVDPVDEVGPGLRYETPAAFLSWLDDEIEQARAYLDELAREGVCAPVPHGYDVGELPDLLDNVHIIAGAHPYGALELDRAALERMERLLDSPRCVGVGEIGIDVGPYAKLSAADQERAFSVQLAIAHERGLSVELHLRDEEDGVHTTAHDVAARILQEQGVPKAGCDLHCFTAGPEVMAPFVQMGCHIAFGGASTFRRSEDIRAAAANCPAELLLSETDSPYMAPEPLRGCECEPGMVAFTIKMLDDLRAEAGAASGATARQLWHNACSFFHQASPEP